MPPRVRATSAVDNIGSSYALPLPLLPPSPRVSAGRGTWTPPPPLWPHSPGVPSAPPCLVLSPSLPPPSPPPHLLPPPLCPRLTVVTPPPMGFLPSYPLSASGQLTPAPLPAMARSSCVPLHPLRSSPTLATCPAWKPFYPCANAPHLSVKCSRSTSWTLFNDTQLHPPFGVYSPRPPSLSRLASAPHLTPPSGSTPSRPAVWPTPLFATGTARRSFYPSFHPVPPLATGRFSASPSWRSPSVSALVKPPPWNPAPFATPRHHGLPFAGKSSGGLPRFLPNVPSSPLSGPGSRSSVSSTSLTPAPFSRTRLPYPPPGPASSTLHTSPAWLPGTVGVGPVLPTSCPPVCVPPGLLGGVDGPVLPRLSTMPLRLRPRFPPLGRGPPHHPSYSPPLPWRVPLSPPPPSGPPPCGIPLPQTGAQSAHAPHPPLRSFCWGLSLRLSRAIPFNPPRRLLFRLLTLLVRRLRLGPGALLRLISVLRTLPSLDWFLLWLRRYYPELFPSPRPSPILAARGLGRRGAFPIPLHIWNAFVPASLLPALQLASSSLPRPFPPPSPTTRVFLDRLLLDGFFCPLPGCTPNCHLFVLPKSDVKVSLIADLRYLNTFSPLPLPSFALPTPSAVGSLLASLPRRTLVATTLDLSNFYWSLDLPLHWRGVFCVPGGYYPCLPFGWNLAPVIAQHVLLYILDTCFCAAGLLPFWGSSLWAFVYLDDVLLLADDPSLCSVATSALTSFFQHNNLIISPKSVLTPSSKVSWLGKTFHLPDRTVSATAQALTRTVALALLAAVSPLSDKRLDVLLGTLNWSFQPGPGSRLFLGSWYAFRHGLHHRPPAGTSFFGVFPF